MPIIYELAESRSVSVGSTTRSLTLSWIVTGTASEDAAYLLVLAATLPAVGRLTRTDVKLDPKGGGVWLAEVTYSPADPASAVVPDGQAPDPPQPQAPEPTDPMGPQYGFDTTGQTVHITQSLETVASGFAVPLAGAPDHQRAIGVDKDKVNGVDVTAPKLEWTCTATRAICTFAYVNAIGTLTGKTNAEAFYGFPAKSVLYLGATGQYGQDQRWTVTHKFAYSANKVNVNVGNGIVVGPKNGWDYLWVAYSDAVSNDRAVQIPTAAYVERVYETGNFAIIEIGG